MALGREKLEAYRLAIDYVADVLMVGKVFE